MQKFILSVAAMLASAFVVGCSNESEPTRYLLPVLAESGQTELREVTIETLSDPYSVSGPAARVLYNPELNYGGVSGDVAHSRLAKNGDVFIPLDVATSESLSVYSTFEQIKKLEDRVLGEKSLLSWPRTVGLHLLFDGGMAVNNAFYTGDYDFIGILPYASSALPLSYNSGILAHEHFHAHFQSLIMKNYNTKTPTMAQADHHGVLTARCGLDHYSTYTSAQKQQIINDMIFRSWNEGFADLYAYLVSGNSNFFSSSLAGEDRIVTSLPGRLDTRADFESYLEQDLRSYDTNICLIGSKAYAFGTQLARTMVQRIERGDFDSFEANQNWTRKERAIRFVFSKLHEFSNQVGTTSGASTLETTFLLDKMTLQSIPVEKIL